MDFIKFRIQKKWWERGNYKIYDHKNEFWGHLAKSGFINVQRFIVNTNGELLLKMTKADWGYNYNFNSGEEAVASIYRSVWGKPNYHLHIENGKVLDVILSSWQKKFEFFDQEGQSLAIVSATNSSYNDLGLAIKPEVDAILIIAATAMICTIEQQVRGAG